jgi:hypothetical protein
MDTTERTTVAQQIIDAEARIEQFEALQDEIDKLQAVKDGKLYRVHLIAEDQSSVAVPDEEIITKSGVVLDRLIAEKLAEQAAV